MSNYCELLCILCLVKIHFANTLFDRSLFNSLTEIENAQITHKVTRVTRKRSVTLDSVPSSIQTSVKSDQHDVTLTFKQSERHLLSPLLYANSRKPFYKPCISAYEDVANNAHAIVDSCNNENNLQMLAEVLIENEVYVILPNQSLPSDTQKQHGFFRVQPLPYNLTSDYVEPDNTDIPVPPKVSRIRRQTDSNIVELVFVIDPFMYAFWKGLAATGTNAERENTANEYIQKYYTFLANGMDARYRSLTTYDLNINVMLVGIYVAETQDEMNLTVTVDSTDSTRGVVSGEELLPKFKTWVADQRANNQNFPSNADHYMLMTGYDISLNGRIESAGYAYLGKICTPEAVSLVDIRFDLVSGAVAAHELGHSLGGRHDGLIEGCSDADGYVLAASNSAQTQESKIRNPWIFSSCSATLFKSTVSSLNSAMNCLLTHSTTYEKPGIGVGPGQTFSPDRQCEIIVGKTGSEMKRSVHHEKYEEICTGMWCTDGNITTLTLVIPAEGTTCGNNKWCSNGECVSSSDAPTGDETCLFGDQPGDSSFNQTCATVVAENKANCYQEKVAASCCSSCAQAKVWNVSGCEYGDVNDCTSVSSAQCYDSIIRNVKCCNTCKGYEKPNLPADCKYGDYFSNCVAPHCADLSVECCETCHITSPVVNWCAIDVPAAIIEASTKPKGQTAEAVKLADAIKSSSASHIVGKIVQTSTLKYRRNGELPIRFLAMKDSTDGSTVKVALFGADAEKHVSEGDVIRLTDTYRYRDTQTLSTKKTTKFEYLPRDTLSVSVSRNDELDDDEFFDLDILNEPEEFQVKGVISAYVYRCCPKPECRNKKLETLVCPTCKASDSSQIKYYCAASLVLKRQQRYETRKSFMPDFQQLVDLPPINTLADNFSFRDFLTSKLPVNARGTFRNGNLMLLSTKRPMP